SLWRPRCMSQIGFILLTLCFFFHFSSQLHEHGRMVHGRIKLWACAECELMYDSVEWLLIHTVYAHFEGRFQCSHKDCPVEEATLDAGDLHTLQHYNPTYVPRSICFLNSVARQSDFCCKIAANHSDLIEHQRSLVHFREDRFIEAIAFYDHWTLYR